MTDTKKPEQVRLFQLAV